MSQKMRNRDRERESKSHQRPHPAGNGGRYEGFEGMNYEQVRQPYGTPAGSKTTDVRNDQGERKDG